MNNCSDNIVWQFRYGGFNGTGDLLIEFVVVELFKFKGKMSATPQVEITADHQLEEGKCTDGGQQRFLMNNSSDDTVRQFSSGGFNSAIHLLIEFVAAELFKFKGKMSALLGGNHCRSPAGEGKMHPWWRSPIPYE